MTIKEKVKALIEGRVFRVCGYDSVIFFDEAETFKSPFKYKDDRGVIQSLDGTGAWNLEWAEIKAAKLWQPEHGEKVLCRNGPTAFWECGFYSHSFDRSHSMIGGTNFFEIAPFDMKKLGKVKP